MGRGPVVEVEGARELRASLAKAGADLNDLSAAHAEVATYVAAAAQGRAPKLTGTLAATIRGNKAKTSAVVKAGGAKSPYAGPIHWGWPGHNIAANPFMSNAATETEPTWLDMYFQAMEDIVEKIKGA